MLPAMPNDYTLSASAIVLPSKQKRGMRSPTTPDMTGPTCRPTRMRIFYLPATSSNRRAKANSLAAFRGSAAATAFSPELLACFYPSNSPVAAT